MKKFSTFLCMVLCSIALHARVVTGTCGDNLTWSYDTETKALTIEGSGAMTDYDTWGGNLPWAQVSYDILSISLPEGLTSIGGWAFYDCSSLTSITLPNSVTSIGNNAFDGCSSLTSITLPNSVTSIGGAAFLACSSLTSITLPNSVTSIGGSAFYGCSSLTSVTIGNSVTSIGSSAFWYCSSLTSITLGNSVTSIGDYAFADCSSLTSITLPNSVTSIGHDAFWDCSSLTSVTLGNSVTSIGGSAFQYCTSLTSITLPNSVTSIESWAFYNCSSITSITIPNSVTSIGKGAFKGCSSLTSIILPNSITSIEYYTFQGCSSLTSITLPNSVTSIGDYAFASCAQVTVECTTPPTIESNTFKSDASIFVPCSALDTYLQTTIWQWLDLKGLSHTINLSATEGGKATITATDCNANTATIEATSSDNCLHFVQWSDGITDNPRTLNLTQDTTLVAHFAEKHQVQVLVDVETACKNMGTVSGSGSFYQGDVVTITATPNEGYHFVEWSDNGDSHATRDILLASDTTLFATFAAGDMGGKCGDNLYWTWNNGALTITGTGDMDLFTHPAWWQYEEIQITSVSMPEGMTSISSNAFEGYSIASIIVPASVETVGNRAFADNNQLTHFEYLGNNIHWGTEDWYWDNMPLYGCRNLQYFRGNVELGNYYRVDTLIVSNGIAGEGLEGIQYVDLTNADNTSTDWSLAEDWEGIPATRTLYLPTILTEITDFAFLNLRYLKEITIPAGVTYIGAGAFEDCRSMDSVIFAGNNVQEIGDWAFYNCHSLRTLTLPEGVEEIGRAAFFDCTYLNELTLPSTMKKIADNGFAGCEKIKKMYVNALVPPTIEAKTFEDVDRATPVFVPKGTLERYQADEYWSEFFNMAEYEAPSGNLNTAADNDANTLRKVLRDGQVLILRGDKTYNVMGQTL